jgi:ribonucleoside-diphosphate reductase alpha chain
MVNNKQQYMGITIDYSRDNLFDRLGLERLRDGYMLESETSPQQRFAYVAHHFGTDQQHRQNLYEYASKHWLSFSTPLLSYNDNSARSLPISCYLPYMHDSAQSLVDTLSETNWLSMLGGGIGIGVGIRSADNKSTGVMSHLKIYDASSLAYRQGHTRRGSYAVYLDISHPDILMFLEMRKPTGDQNIRCLNLHHGINITDDFMELIEKSMIDGSIDDSWNLIDPATKIIVNTISARELWQRIIEIRTQTGEPYLHFIDTSNRYMPEHLKKLGLSVKQSNLCTEIVEPTNAERTAVCCLSSLNLEYYDQWSQDPNFIADVAEMLDNALTKFITKGSNFPAIHRAVYSASQERSIGIGALGFHAFLQQHNVAFESALAKSWNMKIFKHIKQCVDQANRNLGASRGSPADCQGTGLRFSHCIAIAPNASSSIIMGNTSPSIEPYRANAYRQDTLSGAFLNKNRHLDTLIRTLCVANSKLDYEEIWSSIISNDGSIQHLDCFDDYTKAIFKTAMEIDQRWIIEHASDRQQFIDQAQSVNLFFRPDADIKYLHVVHYMAWKRKLKSLYYCRSDKLGKADKVSKQIERRIIDEIDIHAVINDEECLACQ